MAELNILKGKTSVITRIFFFYNFFFFNKRKSNGIIMFEEVIRYIFNKKNNYYRQIFKNSDTGILSRNMLNLWRSGTRSVIGAKINLVTEEGGGSLNVHVYL